MQYLKCLFVAYVVLFFYNKLDKDAKNKIEDKIDNFDKSLTKEEIKKKTDSLMTSYGTALLLIITTLIYILGSFMLW